MDNQQPAVAGQHKFLLGNHHHPEGFRKFFIIRTVFFVFILRDKYVGQGMAALELEQTLKIMGLIALDAKPFHHM